MRVLQQHFCQPLLNDVGGQAIVPGCKQAHKAGEDQWRAPGCQELPGRILEAQSQQFVGDVMLISV